MRWWLILSLYGLILGGPPAKAGENCGRCHSKKTGLYSHSPYEQNECGACHLKIEIGGEEGEVNLEEKEIRWVKRVNMAGGEVYFPLPERVRGRFIVVEPERPKKRKVLDLQAVEAYGGEEGSSGLKRVYPCDKVKGVFTSVKLCVEAGVPLEIGVFCKGGLKAFGEGFATFQEVWLEALKPGRYRCKVKGRTLSGKEVPEREIVVDTEGAVESEELPEGKAFEVSLVKVRGVVFVHLKSSGRMGFRIGYLPPDRSPKVAEEVRDEIHRNLRSFREAGTFACYRCHEGDLSGVNHPVEVVYREAVGKKVKAKPGLPLFEGRVACASCHLPHVSELPYLLRKKGKDLCLSCHPARYFSR